MTQAFTVTSPEELMALARKESGIEIVDHAALEPLTVLVRSLNTESQLHEEGARGMQSRLVRILANRLRMQRDFAAHPEIAEQKVTAPLFICGMARTGSTKTQKMLAASGDFNWLPYWQVINPSLWTGDRSESPQPRIDDTEAFAQWFDTGSPETKYGHAFDTHEPEEESFILEHSLRTPTFLGWAPIGGYLEWLFTQDMTAHFVHLRDTLKYLQWQGLADPAKRWVLKSPLYSGLELQLLDIFPDAKLVMTHRHPALTTASGLRLLECFYRPYTHIPIDIGNYVQGQMGVAAAHMQCRAALPDGTFHDVLFESLVESPEEVARTIYAFCGMTLSDASLARMKAWDAANPQHRLGKHSYSLEQYGLSQAMLDQGFGDYIALLERLPEGGAMAIPVPLEPGDPNAQPV
jgi:hypothetical protein